jgi:molybdate transport system permease protein
MVDLTPLWLSLKVASTASAALFFPGALLAWQLAHGKKFRGKLLVEAFFSLPLVLPPTVTGFYLLLILGRGTAFGRWVNDVLGIRLVFTWEGAAIAAAIMGFPLFVRTASSAFAGIDTGYLEAGRNLGANEPALLRWVIFPLSFRGVFTGLTLAFCRCLGEFGATIIIAGSIPGQTQTLPLALYDAVQNGNNSVALSYTAMLSVTAFGVLGLVGLYESNLARLRGG